MWIALVIPLALALLAQRADVDASNTTKATQLTPRVSAPRTPPVFVRNAGQFDTPAQFVARFPNMLVRVETGAVLLQLFRNGDPADGVLLRMEFEGASPTHDVVGENRQDIVFSYFRGADPEKWYGDVGAFGQVRLRGLYDGVDLVLREEAGVPKYDLEFERAGDAAKVVVRVDGLERLSARTGGGLVIQTAAGSLDHPEGRAWQPDGQGGKRWLPAGYRQLDERRFGFDLSGVDAALPLVIDPPLVWSTYLGSSAIFVSGDIAWSVDIDDRGNVVTTGESAGPDFPSTPGAYTVLGGAPFDLFITKLRASDGSLAYSAIVGGDGQERPQAIRFGRAGRATVVGWTQSLDFPTTVGALDRVNLGVSHQDAFVLRLNPTGSDLEYSTLLGNDAFDQAFGLAIAPSGAAVVVGTTGLPAQGALPDFPVTPGAFQSAAATGSVSTAFIARLNPDGSALEWSTFLGKVSIATAVALDSTERVLVAGTGGPPPYFPVTPGALLSVPPLASDRDIFVARMSSDGTALGWGAVFGGWLKDDVTGIALDSRGDVYVCGHTQSNDFPTTPGAFQTAMVPPIFRDAWVARIDASGSAFVYATYIGNVADDQAHGIAVDPSGVATTGGVSDGLIPTTPGAYRRTGMLREGFIARLTPDGRRSIYTTFVGGPNSDLAFALATNATGRVAIAGVTNGTGYPTTPGSAQPNFAGGQFDAAVTVMELHPQGVEPLGASTPSCLGPLQLQVSRMPEVGATRFSLLCSAAPPNTAGWLLISSAAAQPAVVRSGATVHIDPTVLSHQIPVTSDIAGFVEVQVPSLQTAVGARYYAQYLFTGNCGASTGWTASNALEITVQ